MRELVGIDALADQTARKLPQPIIPFIPGGWDPSAGGFPAMVGPVAFLMKDVALLGISIYLLKEDATRLLRGEVQSMRLV
ncbi:MAG TPA: DUF417 family protein [Caulobacteraceae bacterium]|nr:DUF417 family protein [Caulobacteraceae bacterium]